MINCGNTASIGIDHDGNVLKFPRKAEDVEAWRALDIEAHILRVLGSHDRIVQYLGRTPDGLLFVRAINGNMTTYMRRCASPSSPSLSAKQRWRWSLQAAEAVAYIHSFGVIHSDLYPNNCLVDHDLDLCLCDFSGSVFGDLDGQAMESTRFWLPRDMPGTPSITSDIFALGSLLYWVFSGKEPFSDLEDQEVITCFKRMEFPATDELPCGAIMISCWQGQFGGARKVVDALQSVRLLESSDG